MTLQSTKSLLAKLLATENITVEFRKVDTAYFDVKNRVMTLPLWDDMSPELYDLLGGHEVGHALNTPPDGWHNAIKANVGKNFKTFLNVVEDARIERKIKEKFPGIRKSFSKGYAELMARDFFGINKVDVNGLLLIDRINIHFKLGALAGVEFSEQEMGFVHRIEKTSTWMDVVEVATDLFAYCKQELEQMREEQQKRMQSMKMNDFEDTDEFEDGEETESFDDFDFDDDGEESESSKTGKAKASDEDGDEDEEGQESSRGGDSTEEEEAKTTERTRGAGGTGYSHIYSAEDEPVSITDRNFQEKVKTLGQSKGVTTGVLPSFSETHLNNHVIGWRKLYGKMVDTKSEYYKADLFSKAEAKNKNAVAYLVKEFEMRKKAAELRRVSIADTGTIDTNLLHSYKFSDNIFRKIANVAEGKNHGLVAMIDWSGSMQTNLSGTVEQLLVLTLFCRKVNIPFEVYAFSDAYSVTGEENYNSIMKSSRSNQLDVREYFRLLNLLSSKMSAAAFRKTANDLLNVAAAYSGGQHTYTSRYMREDMVMREIRLGGTPLNASIIALSKVVHEFRLANKLEVVNTVILTDGEDSDYYGITNTTPGTYRSLYPENDHNVSYVFDEETKKNFKVGVNGITPTLLSILKARTGCNLIGFYLITKSKRYFDSALSRIKRGTLDGQRQEAYNQFKNNGVYALDGYGYDEYYLIPGGEDLQVSDDNLDDLLGDTKDDKLSTRRLAGAFMKLNQNRLNSRVLLKKFIEKTT